jgi:hypothetical protein
MMGKILSAATCTLPRLLGEENEKGKRKSTLTLLYERRET